MNNRLNAQWDVSGYERKQVPVGTPTAAAPAEPTAGKPVSVYVAQETLPPLVQTLEIVTPMNVPSIPSPPSIALDLPPEPRVDLYSNETLPMPRQVAEQFELFTETVVTSPIPVRVAPPIPVEPAPLTEVPMVVLVPVIQPLSVPPVAPLPTPSVQPFPPLVEAPGMPKVQQMAVAPTTKLKMLVRLGDGKPRFEIRQSDSTDLLFKVYGEKVETQPAPEGAKASAIAGMTATGKVRFVGPGVEGTCDQLTVLSGTGEVLLKGNVCMKTRHGKSWSEMTADKMMYQIGLEGISTPTSSGTVRPASYNWRE